MEPRAVHRKYRTVEVTCTFCGAAYLKRLCEMRPSGVNLCTRVCQSRYMHDEGRRWGVEEGRLLRRLVADGLPVVEISWLMGWDQATLVKYGAKRPERSRVWSAEELELLRAMAPHMGNAEIAAFLDRSTSAIKHRVTILRIKQDPAFHKDAMVPYYACPPELQEVMRLQKQLKEKLRAEEHRRPA